LDADLSAGHFSFPVGDAVSTILNAARNRPQPFLAIEESALKELLLFMMVWLLCTGVARAQEPDEAPPNLEMQRQELINLEKENARAIKLHNPTFFRSAYSEDFHGVSRYGEVVNKAVMVQELESTPLEFDSVVSSDAQVRMFRDTAYVLSLRSEMGRRNGKKFYNQFRILRVYVNTPRGWKIVSELETKLATDERP
jgi:hypothetical protein